MKLPEPVIAREECAVSSGEYYTADQMHQMRIDTLEEAAELAEMHDTCAPAYIAESIRVLKEKKHD